MKLKIVTVLVVLIGYFFIQRNYFGPMTVYPPDDYQGDGEIIFIEGTYWLYVPSWLIKFDEFSLSKEFEHTYSFTGLPGVKCLNKYHPYLYTSPSTNNAEFNDAMLQMTLFADGKQVSTYRAPMKDWNFTDPYSQDESEYNPTEGDDKNFYSLDVDIPYDPTVKYQLKVHYIPPESMAVERIGYLYIMMVGGL